MNFAVAHNAQNSNSDGFSYRRLIYIHY